MKCTECDCSECREIHRQSLSGQANTTSLEPPGPEVDTMHLQECGEDDAAYGLRIGMLLITRFAKLYEIEGMLPALEENASTKWIARKLRNILGGTL